MPISLPDSPTDGQTVQIGTIIYTYDATAGVWNSNSAIGPTLSPASSSTTVYADMTALIAATGMSNGDQAFVTGNNNLYIYSGSGWYKIATVQNDSPSAITGVNGTYELAIDGTATTITAVSTDPEGFPLTWSYSTSGLGSIATVSQTENVFTITPSTTEADAGTFTLTINATDGVNGAVSTSTSLTLNLIITVTNSRYTTLLATATDTSDNNNITDASANSHTITVNGDAHAGTFSPYRSGGYSLYFDGTGGDYVRSPTHADFGFSTDDFTIECWYYPVSKAQNYPRIWHFGPYWSNADSLCFQDRHNTWSTTFSLVAFSGGEILNSTTTVENNTWYHLTVERSGTAITLYVNGVAEDTYNIGTSQFITSSTSYVTLGNVSDGGNLSESQAHGYIRDFRYVKGAAIYNGNFTPTTEPLAEVTNTKLFTAHLPYIIDGSNNHSFTIAGTPYTKPFSPYDYDEYSATDHGGSVYFDGTGDYLLINNPPTLGANDWTFETWYYSASVPLSSHNVLLSQGPGNNTLVSSFSISNTGEIWIQTYNTTNVVLYNTAAGIINGGMWNHIVLTHDYDGSSGGTYKIYANGNQVGNVSYTSGYHWNSGGISGTPLAIAQYRYNTQANGACYFSDWKISNSVTYSSNFTPPTAPLSSSGAELHIKGTDASIIDKSQGSNLKLIGNTTGSTTQVKFAGSKSMYFDGTTDYIISQEPVLLGTQDFTAECWVYYQSGLELMGNRNVSDSGGFSVRMTSTSLTVGNSSGTGFGSVFSGTTSSLTNAWHHIAVSRSSGVTKIYVDGSSIASYSSTINFSLSNPFVIGYAYSNGSGADSIQGYIQDFRITKGLARYTANFTPPAASLEG